MVRALSVGVCFSVFTICANIGTKGFAPYKNYYFVETGTCGGNAVKKAICAGFMEAHSIELDANSFKFASVLLAPYHNVHLYLGNSAEILWQVIQPLAKPITFWLDAHRGPGEYKDDGKNSPILAELEQIKKHPIKKHTILIDDMSGCGKLPFDFVTLDQIKAKILEINPNYKFHLIEGGDADEAKDNILVAQPR